MTCSPECFEAYGKQVIEARAANKKVNLLPERTDMTEDEVRNLINRDTDEVIAETREELQDYIDGQDNFVNKDGGVLGSLGAVIDSINQEIIDDTAQAVNRIRAETKRKKVQGIPKGLGNPQV